MIMTRFSFTMAGMMFSLAMFIGIYLTILTISVNAIAIERRAGRKQLYNFKFSYFNSSDEETASGKTGFNYDGYLRPFGHIQGGGGFDYEADDGFGGGSNIGLSDPDDVNKTISGLETGFRFNQTNVDIGAGISAFDQKVNFQLDIAKDGTIFVQFDVQGGSATNLDCQPSDESDQDSSGMVCTATPNSS